LPDSAPLLQQRTALNKALADSLAPDNNRRETLLRHKDAAAWWLRQHHGGPRYLAARMIDISHTLVEASAFVARARAPSASTLRLVLSARSNASLPGLAEQSQQKQA
jgi:hypothetical protein